MGREKLSMLKNIIELSLLDEPLRFIKINDLQQSDLLNDLEEAQRMVLDGNLLGVEIECD